MNRILIILIFSPLISPAQTDQLTTQSVLAFERARFEATRTSNVAKLREMLVDELTWVHSSGKRQNKAAYVHGLEISRTSYKSITVEESSARLFGNLAVTTGLARYDAISEGNPMIVQAYHTAVYRYTHNRWQVIAWQATRIQPGQ